MSVPQINLNHFETYNRGILQCCNRIRSTQEELQSVVDALAKNDEDYKVGRQARDSYSSNHRKFTKERRRLEKEINSQVRESVGIIAQAKKTVREQRA